MSEESYLENEVSPAPQVARIVWRADGAGEITLSDGNTAIVRAVSAALIDEVTSRVKEPEVPNWYNPEKERDEPNPSDPSYLRALADMERRRGMAAIDALIMFGLELKSGLPEGDEWLKKLLFMEKRGMLSLDGYDTEDPYDREFLYKRFVVLNNDILSAISEVSGVSSADVERQERSFRGQKRR